MKVRDREDDEIAVFDGVDQTIWEPVEAAAAEVIVERMPRLRQTCGPIRGSQHLDKKRIAQTRRLRVVPLDGFVEFGLGNLKKPDRHGRYLAIIVARSRGTPGFSRRSGYGSSSAIRRRIS